MKTRRHGTLRPLGAALYWAGRYREAVDILNEAIASKDGKGEAQDWVFLALAHHRLGEAAEAKRWLEKISIYTPNAGSLDWGSMKVEILRQEAERIIRP